MVEYNQIIWTLFVIGIYYLYSINYFISIHVDKKLFAQAQSFKLYIHKMYK